MKSNFTILITFFIIKIVYPQLNLKFIDANIESRLLTNKIAQRNEVNVANVEFIPFFG